MYNKNVYIMYTIIYVIAIKDSSTLIFAGLKCLPRGVKKEAVSSSEVRIEGRKAGRALLTAFCRQ